MVLIIYKFQWKTSTICTYGNARIVYFEHNCMHLQITFTIIQFSNNDVMLDSSVETDLQRRDTGQNY